MKLVRFFLVALSMCVLPGKAFADYDAKQCQRIDDVAVPYDVAMDNASVTFSSGSDRIVVRPALIEAAGRALSGPQIGPYYGDIRRFLDGARTMANAALPFSGGGATIGMAATHMCTAIVNLAASSAAVEQAFPGFVSPVRVKFK